MFALFVNDLEEYLIGQGTKFLNFGDELLNNMSFLVVLYAGVNVILSDNKSELQKSLDGHYKYCKEWKLDVNPTKTKDIVFSRRKPKTQR